MSHQDIINCGEKFVNQISNNPNDHVKTLISNGSVEDAQNLILSGCYGGLLVSVCNYLVVAGLPSEEQGF